MRRWPGSQVQHTAGDGQWRGNRVRWSIGLQMAADRLDLKGPDTRPNRPNLVANSNLGPAK